MPTAIDVEFIVSTIDEACRDWKEKFRTSTNQELIEAISNLCYNCTPALIELSVSGDDNEQTKQDRLNAERIVSKLKEFQRSLGNLWPSNLNSFGRDVFEVGSYHVEAAEFFQPVPFYPNIHALTKLYRWSVYDTNQTIVCRYHLERSEVIPGQPYCVLGKSYANGHSQIQPYGTTVPEYNEMKNDVINDLTGQGPPPIVSLSIPSNNH